MSITDTLVEYMHNGLIEYWELMGVEFFKTDKMFLSATKIPFSFMNVLIHNTKNISASDLPEMYACANQFFRSHNVPWTWWLEPYVHPPGLDRFLMKRGYSVAYSCPSMVLDLSYGVNTKPLEGYNIKEVISKKDFEEWVKPIRRSFNCPQHVFDLFSMRLFDIEHGPDKAFRHFIVIDDEGMTVAASTLHISSNVSTIYNVATRPEHRKKGFGMAATVQAVVAAKERNLDYCFLDTSRVGYNLYHRVGFRQFSECKIYGNDA